MQIGRSKSNHVVWTEQRWFIFERKERPITIGCKVQWLGVCSATAKAAKVLPLKSAPSGLLHAGEGVQIQGVEKHFP